MLEMSLCLLSMVLFTFLVKMNLILFSLCKLEYSVTWKFYAVFGFHLNLCLKP